MADELEEIIRKATSLRNEGRLEEAIVVGRRATQLGPDNANAWWQLALAIGEKDGKQASIPALEKVTELAPGFAAGWGQLGWAYYSTNRVEQGIAAAEQGRRQDPDHTYCLRVLAIALKGRDDEESKTRRLDALQRLYRMDELDEDDHFDLAFLLGDLRDHLEAAHVYEAYSRKHGENQSVFFNLSIAYASIGRDLDALDVLAKADATDPSLIERRKNRREMLLEHLLAVRKRVLATPDRVLPKEMWYRHYINPFVLLNVEEVDEVYSPKALQRARQAVLREIELEDGKVEWLPGLELDKSSAIALLETLSNDEAWTAHQVVFENKTLCEFLMKGDLRHFLVSLDCQTYEPVYLLHEETLRVIGPKFAAQYDEVLTRAVEDGAFAAVECLFDGRRWVLPEHEEKCFEGAKRAVDRLCAPLMALADAAEGKPLDPDEVKTELAKSGLDSVLGHLPIEFHETHTKIAGLLRTLSIAYYNTHTDADAAKAIVLLGKVSADKSPALSHTMSDDLKFLDSAIAEQRKHEVHLTLNSENLTIRKEGVRLGDKFLDPDSIEGIRWGGIRVSNNPRQTRYILSFIGGEKKPVIDVVWNVFKDFETQEKFWGDLIDATMNYITPNVYENLKGRLRNGGREKVGPLVISKEGIQFTYSSWFSEKTVVVPWTDTLSEFEAGVVSLKSKSNSKAHAQLDSFAVTNAFLLHLMCSAEDKTL